MGLLQFLQPVVQHGLEYGKRREDQRRWEEVEKPYKEQQMAQSQAQWGEDGYYPRKLKLDEDIFKQRVKEFDETLKGMDADRGIRRTEDETRRVQSGISLIMRTMQESPENVQQIADAVLKPYGYDLTFEPTPEDNDDWKVGVIDSGLFYRMNPHKSLKEGGLELFDERNRLGDIKPKDQFNMLEKELKAIGSKYESIEDMKYMAERGDPSARQDFQDYQSIWNRMREISGMGPTLDEKYAADTAAGYEQSRLGKTGQPPRQEPEWHRYR